VRLSANILTGVVAVSHIGFLVLEMGLWTHPTGRKIFAMTPEFARSTAVLAANQGLYNGFLAAGLIWGLISGRRDLKLFFLGCVMVAGVFGGLSAKIDILFVQALPAAIAAALVYLTPPASEV
jgi:putative membrane protein